MPVLGSVAPLLYGEELRGTFPGGGPAIVYLGVHSVVGSVTNIYFILIVQGTSNLFTSSPFGNRNVHPPNGGNVLTGTESGASVTVNTGFVQNGVGCTTVGRPKVVPSWVAVEPSVQTAIGFFPLRNTPAVSVVFNDRADNNLVFTTNYTFPLNVLLGSSIQDQLTSGVLGIRIDSTEEYRVRVAGITASFEERHTSINRFVANDIVLSVGGVVVDSDTFLGVLSRHAYNTTVAVGIRRGASTLLTLQRYVFYKGYANSLNIV